MKTITVEITWDERFDMENLRDALFMYLESDDFSIKQIHVASEYPTLRNIGSGNEGIADPDEKEKILNSIYEANKFPPSIATITVPHNKIH